jgi:hypothetical protein
MVLGIKNKSGICHSGKPVNENLWPQKRRCSIFCASVAILSCEATTGTWQYFAAEAQKRCLYIFTHHCFYAKPGGKRRCYVGIFFYIVVKNYT